MRKSAKSQKKSVKSNKTGLQKNIDRIKRIGKICRFFGNKKNRKRIDKILYHLCNVLEEKVLWR